MSTEPPAPDAPHVEDPTTGSNTSAPADSEGDNTDKAGSPPLPTPNDMAHETTSTEPSTQTQSPTAPSLAAAQSPAELRGLQAPKVPRNCARTAETAGMASAATSFIGTAPVLAATEDHSFEIITASPASAPGCDHNSRDSSGSQDSGHTDPIDPNCASLTGPNDMVTSVAFHPDYATSKGIILESTDGTSFGFDVGVLGKHSSFFDGLNSLPAASAADVGVSDLVLELPVCSAAIKFALDVLTAQEYATARTPLSATPPSLLESIITMGDAYDIPCIFTELLNDVITLQAEEPVLLTVALFAEDADVVRCLSAAMIAHWTKVVKPGKWWATMLHNKRPSKLKFIQDQLNAWKTGQADFLKAIRLFCQASQFGPRCREEGQCCAIFTKYDGNFRLFRNDVLQQLWERIGLLGEMG